MAKRKPETAHLHRHNGSHVDLTTSKTVKKGDTEDRRQNYAASVSSMEPREPGPGYTDLLPIVPREPDRPAYPVGTLFMAKPKSFVMDSEVIQILWESPRFTTDKQTGKKIVLCEGNRHLYRVKQLANGMHQTMSEDDLHAFMVYCKIPSKVSS